jgi:hypothetical protein
MVRMTAYSQNELSCSSYKINLQKVAMPAKTKKRAKLGIHAPFPVTEVRVGQGRNSLRLTFFDYHVDRITATALASAEGCEKLGHVRRRLTRGTQSGS